MWRVVGCDGVCTICSCGLCRKLLVLRGGCHRSMHGSIRLSEDPPLTSIPTTLARAQCKHTHELTRNNTAHALSLPEHAGDLDILRHDDSFRTPMAGAAGTYIFMYNTFTYVCPHVHTPRSDVDVAMRSPVHGASHICRATQSCHAVLPRSLATQQRTNA